ncbi:MAG: alanine racemase [Actinomycetaceae bacterium]|nr:alanine racemase [Arcanobacterium sp.]MDD7505334.1 alanine racemase [Actinomycetaceae bacterium]MDY6143932.1 alanine racemase [Arcanobacterium sp.]
MAKQPLFHDDPFGSSRGALQAGSPPSASVMLGAGRYDAHSECGDAGSYDELYPSRALISHSAFVHNLERVRQYAPDQEIMAVVKADAYGHGAVCVMRWAIEEGVRWFAIAELGEALEIRRQIDSPCHILALITRPSSDYLEAIRAQIDLTVASAEQIRHIAAAARTAGKRAQIHLEIDTGMARGGFDRDSLREAIPVINELSQAGDIHVNGVWSHLACADDPRSTFTDTQVERFDDARECLEQAGIHPVFTHLAASSGIIWHENTHYNMVRPGIMLYGLSPNPERASNSALDLTPVMELQADIVSTRDVEKGTGVSYGHTAHTRADQRLATVPLGYGDGIPRSASNAARVDIRGVKAHILGRVCMDQFVIGVCDEGGGEHSDSPRGGDGSQGGGTGDAALRVGETVRLFGDPANGAFSADDWAGWCSTINYEIVTRIGPRVPRISVP